MEKKSILEWLQENRSKALALGIAFVYLVITIISWGLEGFLKVSLYLILPLACIFFSDAMGGHTGVGGLGGGPWVTKPTPGTFIAFMGWVLLFFPVVAAIVIFLTSR